MNYTPYLATSESLPMTTVPSLVADRPLVQKFTQLLDKRLTNHPAWVVVVELFLGLGWLRAAIEKIISASWWRGDVIVKFATENADLTLPWYAPIIENIISPTVKIVAFATIVLQLTIAATLLTGYRLSVGLFLAIALNVNIIVAGGVSPSIFYLIMEAALLMWLFESQRPTPALQKWLRLVLIAAVLLIVVSVPFVKTLEPAEVIHDPGNVLATFGMCLGAGCLVALRRWNTAEADDLATSRSSR